jgi:hypothetical protein
MKNFVAGMAVAATACSVAAPADVASTGGVSIGLTHGGSGETSGTGTSTSSEGSSTAMDDGASTGAPGPKYDVGLSQCDLFPPGIHCKDGVAYECDDDSMLVNEQACGQDLCIDGTGCVECVAGEFHCQGAKVMQCDALAQPPTWVPLEVCNAAAGRVCNRATGTCEVSQPVGNTEPTGTYYQYGTFHRNSSEFKGGYDVDGYGDRIYVLRTADEIDVYTIGLVDGDADGVLEANQHPDNPDALGPIEPRTLTFVETIATPAHGLPNHNELYVLEDRLYFGGSQLVEAIFGGATSTVTTPHPSMVHVANLGYDEGNGVWYAAGAGKRRIFQYDASDDTWGIAFDYPNLAGTHMDGMEVVPDPATGTPYVYVSDMTSDFIAQYRLDRDEGWVQQNVFEYAGTPALVEGMGFGPLHHFWVTGGPDVYELGGGDLAEYTDPPG